MGKSKLREEVAHVVGADIVRFSMKPMDAQIECIQALKATLETIFKNLKSKPLFIDTGDGAFLVFSGSIHSAITTASLLAKSGLELRIGVHTGPITFMESGAGQENAYGPGINTCQRIMNAAAVGGLLISNTSAEILRSYEDNQTALVDLGQIEVKHGELLSVFGFTNHPGVDERARKRPKHNLSELSLPFVGRTTELAHMKEMVLDERRRLVTIAGPGGMGKTSLATVTGRNLLADFADGVWAVECDGLKSGEDISAALANILGLPAENRSPDGMREALRDRQCLLILDCLEKVTNLVNILEDWLSYCPGLQILTTSRVVLTSKWESEFFIGPMALKRGVDGNIDSELVFVNAAKQVDSSFEINKSNHALIESIVRSVQGMPLAIVLAAGRLKYVSLAELKAQLDGRKIDILKRRSTAKDRHADLNNVVAESFDLLDPPVRDTLIELSIFSGGFFLSDAEAVLNRGSETLDSIEALRDNSLMIASVVAGRMRYRSLDVVSEYVEYRAKDFNLDALNLRHLEHFTLAAQAVRARFDQGQWNAHSEVFWSDLGNFRKAINLALEKNLSTAILDLAGSLARIFMEAGLRTDFESLALAALDLPTIDEQLKFEIQGLLGGVYRREDNRELAERYWLLRAEGLANSAGPDIQADAWTDLACMALHYSDEAAAKQYLDHFSALEPILTAQNVLAIGSIATGIWHARRGDNEHAANCARKAEGHLVDATHGTRALFAFAFLTELHLKLGENAEALAICRWAIAESVNGKHPSYAGHFLLSLAQAQWAEGETEVALRAIVAASKIPKSVSQTLRTKLNNIKAEFVTKVGVEAYRAAEESVAPAIWHELALEVSEWYNPTWMG